MIDNWKQAAAQQTMADGEVEKAFLDQAYQAIQNKANPIMKAPYRLGFEIVHKNDNNTRMVGIFVFRLGKDLYYAPVFFINGTIKGTDLFYRHATKTFVPLTNEWVDYLLNLNPVEEGYAVEPKVRLEATPSNMDFNRIINPPTTQAAIHKYASAAWADMQVAAKDLPAESLLRRFIVEDGGEDAIKKIANTVAADKRFAKALFYGSDETNYMPELPAVKAAAAPETEELVVHFNILNNANVKQASVDDVRRGYVVEDTRKDASINPIVEAAESHMETIGEPGVYNIMMADGSMKECLVAVPDHDMLDHVRAHDMIAYTSFLARSNPKHKFPELEIVDLDSRHYRRTREEQPAWGEFVMALDKCPELKDSMESGKSYKVFCTLDASLSQSITITKKDKSPAGIDCYEYARCYLSPDSPSTLLYNPDYEGAFDADHVLGKHHRFLEVAAEKVGESRIDYKDGLELGNRSAIDTMIFGDGYKKASLELIGDEYLIRLNDKWSPRLVKTAAHLCLMAECGMRSETADELLTKAATKKVNFFHKQALHIRAQAYPEFYSQFNDAYNVQEEPENLNSHALIAHRDIPLIERNRVGDSVKHEARNQDGAQDQNLANPKADVQDNVLQTASPIQLYEMSQAKGVGNLFEHGVVGSLTKTYDSIALIDKYIPDLEQGLDRIGRILFLYYWKPEDFASAYGSDDQVELENKLLSNFKQLGDMVLELLLKSQRHQQGTSTMKS